MIVRSAFWLGRARDQAAFQAAVDGKQIPALKAMPGVSEAVALWPQRLEDNPPEIACQVLVYFETEDDMEIMLQAPERQALRATGMEIMAGFDGTVSHIVYATDA